MSVVNSLKKAAYALPLVFMIAANANAAGLTPGQCYAKADAEAVLKQEGQMPIIFGNRLTDDKNANVLTVNKLGYGYNIEGDHTRPDGFKGVFVAETKEVCVRATYKSANVYSLDSRTPPEWTKNVKAHNGFDLKKAYANGARVIMGAQTYSLNPDGSETLGKYIMVLAGTNDKLASVSAIDFTGMSGGLFDLDNYGVVTKNMNALLGQTVGQDSSTKP